MTPKKIAVVTGGNRGMGLETCRALGRQGFHVLLTSRDLNAAQQATRSLVDEGLSVTAIKLDVVVEQDIQNLVFYLDANHACVDVLINNAGILIDAVLGQPASIFDADSDILRETFEVNTLAPIRLTNALLPLLRKAEYARIVNISSGMAQLKDMGGGYAGYRISKTALNSATCIFANELEGSNITVNAVCPGWVRTDMGGHGADRSLVEGVDTAVWLATSGECNASGGFYRDRELIDW